MSRNSSLATLSSIVLDVYTVIDLDRTILKSTTLFYDYIIPELLDTYGVSEAIIELVRLREVEQRGRAFDFVAYLNKLALEGDVQLISVEGLASSIVDRRRDAGGKIRKDFVDAILVDGTLSLLAALASRPSERWGIMTSGGELTQTLKCQIVGTIIAEMLGLTVSKQIIATEHKAQTIVDEWYDRQANVFILPLALAEGESVLAKKVRLLDDKQLNLSLNSSTSEKARSSIELYLVKAAERSGGGGLSITSIASKL